MAALSINLLHILSFAINLIHGSRKPIFMLLMFRIFGVRIVIRSDQAIFMRIGFSWDTRVFLINTVTIR